MAQERVQAEAIEFDVVEEAPRSELRPVAASPERNRRRNRTQGTPPATAKRKPHPLPNAAAKPAPELTAEERLEKEKAELSSALITKYSGLVRQIAGGFQRKLPRNVLRDDLIAAGMSGLWDAVRKHGHEQTENFDWYVRVRIRGAILDELRAQDWLPRRARAAAAEAAQAAGKRPCTPVVLRFDDVSETEQARCLTAGESTNTEKTVEARLVKATLTKAMDQLPERERRIVSMHYFRGVKFKDLGEMLGVSEPRISQLHSRAMTRLKGILESAA
jgi:RNA polymerase sigma factor for flagellar operon FliA